MKSCAAVGCNSTDIDMARKFFKFPMLDNSSTKSLAITRARQQAWLVALNRTDLFVFQEPTVCDLHFISGKSAHYTDVKNPDWIPTKNLGYVETENEKMDEQYELHYQKIELCDDSAERTRSPTLNTSIGTPSVTNVNSPTDDDYPDTKPTPSILAKSLEDYVQDDDSYYYDENSRRNQLYWTTDATKTLIKLRGDRESEFEQGGARKSQLWVDICRRMRSLGYDFTPEKVSKKWHNILITYNKNLSKKQHSQQVNWEFFDEIDAVFKNRRLEIESTSSYQGDISPPTAPPPSKRRATAEISFFEIEKINNRVSSEPSSTMQLHEVDEEKEDFKKFKFNPENEFNGHTDGNWWKDYFEQKLELEREKLQKEQERHKDNLNLQKLLLTQDKLKVEAINSLTSAIKEYTRLAEAKQTN